MSSAILFKMTNPNLKIKLLSVFAAILFFETIALIALIANEFEPLQQRVNYQLPGQNKEGISVNAGRLDCVDCTYAPVSKKAALTRKYIPELVKTNLPGGGDLTPETVKELSNLFAKAKKEGIQIEIISAYRSYNDQLKVFQSWVASEMSQGLDQNAAEVKANTYSAKQGQSEHQLGTVVDLKCSTCSPFDFSKQNQDLYEFLEQNAHEFGFVISYPEGKQELTGYIYEPWHIRFIGKANAKELYDSKYLEKNDIYLESYLWEKYVN